MPFKIDFGPPIELLSFIVISFNSIYELASVQRPECTPEVSTIVIKSPGPKTFAIALLLIITVCFSSHDQFSIISSLSWSTQFTSKSPSPSPRTK